MVGNVTQFSRANKGKIGRVEEEDAPAAFGIFLGDFNEFTVFERLVFERFDLVLIKDIYTSSVFSLRSKLTKFC
ncbi:Uncharacterised protein [Salmonella enterica subsp. enterica]|uniref:Uncharacterized protein n=1 Tax=Salmonella enterica I TaxID=59201 RepID=A0A447PIZ8_SALET|nr:Uncharacterised protein [Salmonella enterica subsp. enterica]